MELIKTMKQQNFTPLTNQQPTRTQIPLAEINYFRKNGFAVVGAALSDKEVEQLRQETTKIC